MNKLTCALSIALISALSTASLSTQALAGQDDINAIERAANQLDTNAISQQLENLQGYDLAFAHYRLAVIAHVANSESDTLAALDSAISVLNKLRIQEPSNPEVLALLAQVYGYKAGLQPFKAMYYGMKSNDALTKAQQLAPKNPRVLLVSGIIKANTPALFGGSNEKAEQAFSQAIEAFSHGSTSDYHWGYADAYTWRGVIHSKNGDTDLAKVDWQAALSVQPDFGWASSLLQK